MSNLSDFFSGGGIKSIQTGYSSGTTSSSGVLGEDRLYQDITVSAVDPQKTWIIPSTTYSEIGIPTTLRLVNSTTLRMSTRLSSGIPSSRWTIVEFF